jgi:tungstate transport system substrate-binding protein
MRNVLIVVMLAYVFAVGCSKSENTIRMATTTSTYDSGLLDILLPAFEKKTGIRVDVIPEGTGKALKDGELGNVDLVFVHARAKEDEFVKNGFGVGRRDVMKNDFIILGPKSDPAGIKGMKDADAALNKIAAAKAVFCSRGDNSGTHFKEKAVWKKAGVTPEGKWYRETGQGMGDTLNMANEISAYVLIDRGTYLKHKKRINLNLLVQGDQMLDNPYGIIAVNPKKHPKANHKGAMKFIEWITAAEGQKLINNYKVGGEQLFIGTARLGYKFQVTGCRLIMCRLRRLDLF